MGEFNFASVLFGILGLLAGVVIMFVVNKSHLNKAKDEAKKVLEEAAQQAKNTLKQAVLDSKTQAYELKLQAEKEIKERKSELQDHELLSLHDMPVGVWLNDHHIQQHLRNLRPHLYLILL